MWCVIFYPWYFSAWSTHKHIKVPTLESPTPHWKVQGANNKYMYNMEKSKEMEKWLKISIPLSQHDISHFISPPAACGMRRILRNVYIK